MSAIPSLTIQGSAQGGALAVLMVDLRAVQKFYKSAAGDYHALKGIDLQINPGEFVSIIGKSGSAVCSLAP